MTSSAPRYQVRVHMPPLWSILDTHTQEWGLDQNAGLHLARWRDRRVAEAAAERLNRAYEKA